MPDQHGNFKPDKITTSTGGMGTLVISVPWNGEFFISDFRVSILDVAHTMSFRIKVETPAMDHIYKITDKVMTEVLPGIRISAGDKGDSKKLQIVIKAPRHVKILRGALYRKEKPDASF